LPRLADNTLASLLSRTRERKKNCFRQNEIPSRR
jgi:hypothetical protein